MPLQKYFLLALFLSVVLIFSGTFKNDFIEGHDDSVHVSKNPRFKSDPLTSVGGFWSAPYEKLYIPVTYSVWAATSAISHALKPDPKGKLQPVYFHLLNVLLHGANAILIFFLLRLGISQGFAAFAGAAFFAFHPIQVEAVAWISSLKDILSTTFSLLALLLYFSSRGRPQSRLLLLAAATLMYVFAILSKPSAVILPALVLVTDVFLDRSRWKETLATFGVWSAMGIVVYYLTTGEQPIYGIHAVPSMADRFWVAGDAVFFYLKKLFVPTAFTIEYGRRPEIALADPNVYYFALIPLVLGIALLTFWRTGALGFGWFVVALLPVLGFVPFNHQNFSTVADRYTYLAMLGPAFLVALSVRRFSYRILFLFVPVLACYWYVDQRQVRTWKNAISVFEHALVVNPRGWVAHHLLGIAYSREGDLERAINHYQEVTRRQPNMVSAYLAWRDILLKLDREEEANNIHQRALRAMAAATMEEGDRFAKLGRYAEAGARYYSVTELFPDMSEAFLRLAGSQFLDGNQEAALGNLKRATELNPTLAEVEPRRLLENWTEKL